jgi:molybdopterin converting factor small subunit
MKKEQLNITVKVFGGLEMGSPLQGLDSMKGFPLELPKGSRLKIVAGILGIKLQTHTMILVNGVRAGQRQKLEGGDVVVFYRPVSGG